MNEFKEIIECECGHKAPIEFTHINEDGIYTCLNCVMDECKINKYDIILNFMIWKNNYSEHGLNDWAINDYVKKYIEYEKHNNLQK